MPDNNLTKTTSVLPYMRLGGGGGGGGGVKVKTRKSVVSQQIFIQKDLSRKRKVGES